MMNGDTCTWGDRDLLIAYLYDECGEPERVAVAAHLSRCQSCADELAAISDARRLLAAWTPPEVSLGFRLPAAAHVGGSATEPGSGDRAAWWRQPLPAWAQMAAALAIFAAGLVVGLSRAPSGDLGAGSETRQQLAAATAAVQALEFRVRGIEAAAAASDAPPRLRASTQPADVMPRVNAQLATWDRRIRSDLATREEVARELVQLKREEALMRQQMRDEFQTGLNEVSRVLLLWRNGE